MTKSFGLFIRTYHRDAPRLRYLLRSIATYCTGFEQVVVVCPVGSETAVAPVVAEFPFAELKLCQNYDNDFIGQQITKLTASSYIDTDFIAHVDSDCVFAQPFSPACFMAGEKPALYHREYEFFYRNKVRMPWQNITSQLMCRQVDFEFMALFPIFYPREIYTDLEAWILENHGITYASIENLIVHKDHFSEFNILGAFSYYEGGDRYHEHRNWGIINPTHYLRQFCTEKGREDRDLDDSEAALIEGMIEEHAQAA